MHLICPSCKKESKYDYCPYCGQKKTVKRITWSSFVEELVHFFIHVERGFLRTTWQMLWNPGKIIKSYLDGQRKSIQSPISYLVIWATIYSLSRIVMISLIPDKAKVGNHSYMDPQAFEFFNHYPAILIILFIPIWTFVAWLIALRNKLNYLEVLIVNFYTYGQFFAYASIFTII